MSVEFPVRKPIGRVVATERRPNTAHEFHFWTELDSAVGIGTIVRMESPRPRDGVIPRVYGVVVAGETYTDLQSPLHDSIGFDADPSEASIAPTERSEIRLYTAAVLRHVPDEPLQPVPIGTVYQATDDDVAEALRMDGYMRADSRTAIPIGLYRGGATESPIYLDADFLLGPEAAHLNISGISGLATKTSAVEFVLASLFAHLPAKQQSVAAVCFNVKGPDLLFLDQPSELLEEDRALYERLGVPAAPFEKVEYFAPYTERGYAINTLRSNAALQGNVHPLTWGLGEVLQYAEVLLNRDDIDAKASALIEFIAQKVVDRDFHDERLGIGQQRVRTFADLETWFTAVIDAMEERGTEQWRTHHIATIRKVRNRLSNISTRCKGLVTDDGEVSDLPFANFQDRTVYVIDVANLEDDAQNLIFARVVSKLREHLERRSLGVHHVAVFVDELNKYAAADSNDTYVRQMLLDIAERGRYLGLVLFSAQQFRSQVHRRVVGNSGTALFGRMDADELATPGYAVLSPAIKTKLATLDKGQLMVRHPHFTQPVFVRFPRPAVLSGRDGMEKFPPDVEPSLEMSVFRALRRLDSRLEFNAVADLVALGGTREEDVIRARNATLRARPEKVLEHFKKELRRTAPIERVTPTTRTPIRTLSRDPYGD